MSAFLCSGLEEQQADELIGRLAQDSAELLTFMVQCNHGNRNCVSAPHSYTLQRSLALLALGHILRTQRHPLYLCVLDLGLSIRRVPRDMDRDDRR